MTSPAAQDLVAALKQAHTLTQVLNLLDWDAKVNMPEDSGDARAEQYALVAKLHHEAATSGKIGAALKQLEANAANLSPVEKTLAKYARKDYDQLTKLPEAFVVEKAKLDTESYQAWHEARAQKDFKIFQPYLEKQVAMARQKAAYLSTGDAYDTLLDLYDPGMTAAGFGKLSAELKVGLVPLVRAILSSPVKAEEGFLKGYPIEKQEAFLKEVTQALGFNFKRGRFDKSAHPFCTGDAYDGRLTTRYDENNPLDSLFSAIHETGHGLYEQGLRLDWVGTPLGTAVGMGIHESQSRLWENQVARSHAFWKHWEPKFRARFAPNLEGVTSDQLYLAINQVSDTLIRVDSDEVTYNLHILLRFELEKQLMAGTLQVADLPAAWNKLAQELLGRTPAHDAEGCLQDVHWSDGSFGYFPSYCLGNMIAAQLWAYVHKALPELDKDFERGDFSRLLSWLRTHIHTHGRTYGTEELLVKVTGEEINPQYLLAYLNERYGGLYLRG